MTITSGLRILILCFGLVITLSDHVVVFREIRHRKIILTGAYSNILMLTLNVA